MPAHPRSFAIAVAASLTLAAAAVWAAPKAKPGPEQLAAAEREFVAGADLARQGRVDEAIARTRKALELNPNHGDAHFNLGVLLGDKGQKTEAIKHLRSAVRINPKSINGRYNLAYYLQITGNKDEAISHYKAAIKLAPDHADAHFNLGIILTERKSPEAAEHCRKAAQLNPKLAGPVCKQ